MTPVCLDPQEISKGVPLKLLTNVGDHLFSVLPLPRAPYSPTPHEKSSPLSVKTTVWPHPHEIFAQFKSTNSSTKQGEGDCFILRVPIPSLPSVLLPIVYT